MTDSYSLLAEYARNGSDTAFRELVTRYVDLVYSTALRLVEGDTHRAEDVSQTVFLDLARKARTLPDDFKLGGWLHRATCLVAGHTMRGERRRQSRERQAVEMNALQNHSEADFSRVAPILDEAINELGEADRTAILLRFFEQHDFRSVGQALGSNEDAARMRVTRALEKLEVLLKRRGITTSAAALSVVLTANAVQAAPVGLAVTISTAAALGGTTAAAAATATATKAIAMTTLQKTVIGATLAVAIGAGVYQARQASTLRSQVQTLQQQQAPLAEQLRQLTQALTEATNQVAALREGNERVNRTPLELLKLRGEVGVLRRQAADATNAKSRPAQPPLSTEREYCERGIRHFVNGKAEDALDDFSKALELNPNSTEALYYRAHLLAGGSKDRSPEVAKAVADYSRILEVKPNDGSARYNRAWNYERLKQYDNAIADYTTWLEGDTDFSKTHFYENNESKNRTFAYVHQARGRAYHEYQKDYPRAIADYTAALELDPQIKGVHRRRGQCYELLGEAAKAQQDFAVEKAK
jgi:RNA polymerase sigma factor (sigma-70 family)